MASGSAADSAYAEPHVRKGYWIAWVCSCQALTGVRGEVVIKSVSVFSPCLGVADGRQGYFTWRFCFVEIPVRGD